ncbi:hypothetical protein MLD38_011911 [Melastoma candidum]|uniref:Uncharacterized protein n=1 Tax=Melastoma candidum TaxID=119954 RepID=A0ACB9R4N1_9MYRT|nr:hypothetical protein MLD38_011911 [Melastoma candidum]
MRPLRPSPANSLALTLLFLLIIIILVATSRDRLRPNPSWVVGFPKRNQEPRYHDYYNHYYVGQPRQRRRTHSLVDASRPSPRSQLCDHIEMIRRHHQQQRPFPPPPAAAARWNKGDGDDHEVDPRYGVEKRLVPSGPNPLHN